MSRGRRDGPAEGWDRAAAGDDGPLVPPDLTASLVLVRHGESTWIVEGRFQGRRDPRLSPRGERQAALVAERLRDPASGPPLPIPARPPAAIWHSPLARARQTAEAIAGRQPLATPLQPERGLIEIAQGDWEGLTHAEVVEASREILDGWRARPTEVNAPGGERLLDAAARVRDALQRILAELAAEAAAPAGLAASPVPGYGRGTAAHPWGILVAHDGIFRLALLGLLGIPYERFWSFPFVLCGISVVDLAAGRASLAAHNLADHLAPLATDVLAAAEARGDRRGAL
ncbi:MAG TPA: histidine phosphatase family protein [Candidatus Limnocylindrales bacterium]|nr:histidine phosphatase family protein [Candidatus Limnocylindrales bacterium]